MPIRLQTFRQLSRRSWSAGGEILRLSSGRLRCGPKSIRMAVPTNSSSTTARPFANGLPHYGHLATSFVKDIVPRYQTMRGRHVDRRFGWDCHGLPGGARGREADPGVRSRGHPAATGRQVQRECAESVQTLYARVGVVRHPLRSLGQLRAAAYRTMDREFMESVMWAFKSLWQKGLIYEGYRVVPYSWAVQTTVSNFETRLDDSYRQRADPALTVALTLTPRDGDPGPLRILIWTTTPWTLPSNLALAVSAGAGIRDRRNRRVRAGRARGRRGRALSRASLPRYERALRGPGLRARRGAPTSRCFRISPTPANAFRILPGSFRLGGGRHRRGPHGSRLRRGRPRASASRSTYPSSCRSTRPAASPRRCPTTRA